MGILRKQNFQIFLHQNNPAKLGGVASHGLPVSFRVHIRLQIDNVGSGFGGDLEYHDSSLEACISSSLMDCPLQQISKSVLLTTKSSAIGWIIRPLLESGTAARKAETREPEISGQKF